MSTKRFHDFSRRDFVKLSLASAFGVSYSGWLPRLARAAEAAGSTHRACILLWMAGGPTQTDTFDLKPGHPNGGPSKAIETAVPGIQISEHLPGIAKRMNDLAVIRSLTTQEGDHSAATRLMMTGRRPGQEGINFPSLGSALAKELGDDNSDLPTYVSVSPFSFGGDMAGPGFLGPNYAPLVVSGDSADPEARANLSVENLRPPAGVGKKSMENRIGIAEFLQKDFSKRVASDSAKLHKANFERAVRMIDSNAKGAFKLDEEPAELRDKYGRNRFGQGCLLARRLVERGAAFVEVTLEGWDTHSDNFAQVGRLCESLDPAWSTLLDDLRERGMLENTLVVWMGEFGRTPKINDNGGRDHFPLAWSTVLGGGGVKGGQAYGKTGDSGAEVADNPVKIGDLHATLCAGIGVDPFHENISPEGRPIPIVDKTATVIEELVAPARV
jgi:hypothetical protein